MFLALCHKLIYHVYIDLSSGSFIHFIIVYFRSIFKYLIGKLKRKKKLGRHGCLALLPLGRKHHSWKDIWISYSVNRQPHEKEKSGISKKVRGILPNFEVDAPDQHTYFFAFLPFPGPLPRHMEVPRLGVESEL